jgi:hypothetical protein
VASAHARTPPPCRTSKNNSSPQQWPPTERPAPCHQLGVRPTRPNAFRTSFRGNRQRGCPAIAARAAWSTDAGAMPEEARARDCAQRR